MFRRSLITFLLTSLLFSVAFAVQAEAVNSLFHRSSDPIIGNPKGEVTVVEFFDYQCGHCSRMAPVMANIIKANPNVRFIFKDYPIRGALSQFAARAAVAANYQGKYYEFNHALLSTNKSLSQESILDIAKSVGLNVQKLKKDMKSSKVTSQLNETINLARDLKISGTPSFYVGKTNAISNRDLNYVLGEMSETELQEAINKAT